MPGAVKRQMLKNRKISYRHMVTGVMALMMVASKGRASQVEMGVQLGANHMVRALRGRPIISPGTAKELSKHHCTV